MENIIGFIDFLREYNKLLEGGNKNIFVGNIAQKYIWLHEIERLVNNNICETESTNLFTSEMKVNSTILSLKRPVKPVIVIPDDFVEYIEFDEATDKFKCIDDEESEEMEELFYETDAAKIEIQKLKDFKENKKLYSKLYRAYNDIENDSNNEIVLSCCLIQHTKKARKGTKSEKEDKTTNINQHLFHFPLEIKLTETNILKLSFSTELPYADFFFLNGLPIEKNILDNIIDRFEQQADEIGYNYIFDGNFKNLICNNIIQISSNSTFDDTIYKPENEGVKISSFKVSYSPAINIKVKKPRFFQKLTNNIINEIRQQGESPDLLNLLLRNPNISNLSEKTNYFVNELYNKYEESISNLNADDDFSTFFPLPYNNEQKKIYQDYLNNRITVVTGPPGTGKSHTIVNILCTLLAQGKRVLVTAETDKALESLLEKIPKNFDDLIFTRVKSESSKRFSLENSIDNIVETLTSNFKIDVEKKVIELDKLKGDYFNLKTQIQKTLEKEYKDISINDSFKDLRSYKIWEKFESKNTKEWIWLKDELTNDWLQNFEDLKKIIEANLKLTEFENEELCNCNINIDDINKKLTSFSFGAFLKRKIELQKLKNSIGIDDVQTNTLLQTDLEEVLKFVENYANNDLVISSVQKLKQITNRFNFFEKPSEDITSNLSYSELTNNASKYLRDIETYLSLIDEEKEKIGFLKKQISKQYKQVGYLESVVINSKKCDNKNTIKDLKNYLLSLQNINQTLQGISNEGFAISIDENSNLSAKTELANHAISKVQKNLRLLKDINSNENIINFKNIFNIEKSNVEKIYETINEKKELLNKLKEVYKESQEEETILKYISNKVQNSILFEDFREYLPINEIDHENLFIEFGEQVKQASFKIEQAKAYRETKRSLLNIIPNTFTSLREIPTEFITKENAEYAQVNNYFKNKKIINLQKRKEELSNVYQKIFQKKCEILHDLAKFSFKNNFNHSSIDEFVNLLKSYKKNLQISESYARDNIKFKILARKEIKQISENISCWIMKFGDVLNSVGKQREIFDCIIVDEASQLNFNSLLLGYYGKNMIIVGDEKQTTPRSMTGVSDNELKSIKNKQLKFLGDYKLQIKNSIGLFSLATMVAGRSNTKLKEHFRCLPEIIDFCKQNFYTYLQPLKQINSTNRLIPIDKIYIKNSFREDSVIQKEIDAIKEKLKEILKEDSYKDKTIGVVSLGTTIHTKKLKEIKEELSVEFGRKEIEKHKLTIEEPRKFQGDEKDVMLVSLGVGLNAEKIKANKNPKPTTIVNDGRIKVETQKINVALSRAKEQMILFHSVKNEDLKQDDFRNDILKFFYGKYKGIEILVLPKDETERTRHNVPEPFESWFEYDIAEDLITRGYHYIKPQHKVKEDDTYYNPRTEKETYVNFRLDLVVSNNGKLVAIECDGDPFHTLPIDVEYDTERQEFLERIGWKICRVLYSAYKRNPVEEIDKLVEFIERHTKNDKPTKEKQKVHHKEEQKEFDKSIEIEEKPNNLNSINKIEKINNTNEIIRYFNLNEDGTYTLDVEQKPNSFKTITIFEKDKFGYLLQGYDNGHLNKVLISALLSKKVGRVYKNGFNKDAKLIFLEIISRDEILAIHFKEDGVKKFKAHLTKIISTREELRLQGYKVVYNNFFELSFKVIPIEKHKKIKRLVFQSFTALGKPISNTYYADEWKELGLIDKEDAQPKLF